MPASKNNRRGSRKLSTAPKTHKSRPSTSSQSSGEWEKQYKTTRARLAATLDLKDIDDVERAFLATCQKINRRWTGCNSPFEDFFHDLVHKVEMGRWPTPDDVAAELEDFRLDFDDMRRDAPRFLEAYPQGPARRVAVGVTAPAQEAAAVTEPLSDWMNSTPHECDYYLEMSEGGLDCQPCETVDVTRAEYLELKRTLAKMRGLQLAESASA